MTHSKRSLNILFISDNFAPETNAPATRLHEHAREWVRLGHRVTVVTGAPNFPEGKVYPGYSNDWYRRETVDGIRVVRVKTFIAANRGFLGRITDYLSFMVSGGLGAMIQARPDVVVATSPQFFSAVAGWAASVWHRRPFVFELRDLWPDSIQAVGAMRPSLALRTLERLELFLYRRAARVVSVTRSFRENLGRRGIEREKIAVVRNGVDLSRYAPQERDEALVREFGVQGKFVIGYLGTHGMAHALHRVVDAAERLRHRDDIHFLFVGAGAARDSLVASARERGLTNISFHASVPKERMPAVWSLCNLGLVHLKREELFTTVIPSKIFECFGMGVPVLFAGPDGEGSQIVTECDAGVVTPAEDADALAQAVERLVERPQELARLARNARQAARMFDRKLSAQRMVEVLARAADGVTPDELRREQPSNASSTRHAA
jgi:glycosyltransferase involved in cell wall biosynthesis